MRTRAGHIAAIALSTALAQPALAIGDCDELPFDERHLAGELLGKAWKSPKLPSKGDVEDALVRLDSLDEGPQVLYLDLSGDGRAELILTPPNGRLCGNAGCPYIVLDPVSFRRIGEFFGHLAILDVRVNGYRTIQSFSRYRVGATGLDTFVFDRGAYRLVSHALVDSCGLEQWQRRMRSPK